jgi:hypothetical protein
MHFKNLPSAPIIQTLLDQSRTSMATVYWDFLNTWALNNNDASWTAEMMINNLHESFAGL